MKRVLALQQLELTPPTPIVAITCISCFFTTCAMGNGNGNGNNEGNNNGYNS